MKFLIKDFELSYDVSFNKSKSETKAVERFDKTWKTSKSWNLEVDWIMNPALLFTKDYFLVRAKRMTHIFKFLSLFLGKSST